LNVPPEFRYLSLCQLNAVIADARIMPHEWTRTSGRNLLKFDAAAHGDDHFYPGPTDIAWDIAGAIVEWRLDEEAAGLLVAEYTVSSGDAIRSRLSDYLMAYCVFRLAVSRSAAISESDKREPVRLERQAATYLHALSSLMHLSTAT
jgi:hypothetical protein